MIKIFCVPFAPHVLGFDISEMEKFMESKEVESVCHYFFMENKKPYLVFVVKYKAVAPPPQL